MPVDAHAKKQVPGIPPAVELGAQIGERLHAVKGELAFRAELRDHGERHPGVIAGIAYGSIAEYPVEVAIERQHLSVQPVVSAKTE